MLSAESAASWVRLSTLGTLIVSSRDCCASRPATSAMTASTPSAANAAITHADALRRRGSPTRAGGVRVGCPVGRWTTVAAAPIGMVSGSRITGVASTGRPAAARSRSARISPALW